MPNSVLNKVYFAFVLARKTGVKALLKHLSLQLFSRTIFVGLAKDLVSREPGVQSDIKYSLRLATQEDFKDILEHLDGEDCDSIYELLGRKLFYDRGFHNCYLAEAGAGNICHIAWLLRPEHNSMIRNHYSRLAQIKADEVMLENSFTFNQYRGKKVMASVAQDLADLARSQGFKRIICYVNKDNQPSMKSLARVGFGPFADATEVKLLLSTRRRVTETEFKMSGMPVGGNNNKSVPGAIVIGGTFQSLGILRSLSRKHVPVYLLDSQLCVGFFSRCKEKFFRTPKVTQEQEFLAFLKELALKRDVHGWVIYPNDDETAAFLSIHKDELTNWYRVSTPSWKVVQLAYDKRLTYQLAEEIGIPIPRTFYPRNWEEVTKLDLEFPVIIKPAIRVNFYDKTKKKALRADNLDELAEEYKKAAAVIQPSEIMVQELIPGGPKNLYSFGSFFKNGQVIGKVVARRSRQHPMDFGHATTYAETVYIPEIEELGTRLLTAMGYYGISEVEFMQDPRDKKYKFIEVNARPWGWHSLAIAAGADLPYLLYLDMLGLKAKANGFEAGLKWIRLVTDVPTVAGEILKGRMSLGDYFTSMKGKRTFAVESLRDPLPFLAELALLPYFWKKRGY